MNIKKLMNSLLLVSIIWTMNSCSKIKEQMMPQCTDSKVKEFIESTLKKGASIGINNYLLTKLSFKDIYGYQEVSYNKESLTRLCKVATKTADGEVMDIFYKIKSTDNLGKYRIDIESLKYKKLNIKAKDREQNDIHANSYKNRVHTPSVVWERKFNNYGRVEKILLTKDNNLIVISHYNHRMVISKLTLEGKQLWSYVYENSKLFLTPVDVIEDKNGYVLAGRAGKHGQASDAWMSLVSHNGKKMLWGESYGNHSSSYMDFANAIVKTDDNNYVFAGGTDYTNGNLLDAWIVKVDKNGNVIWQKKIGGSGQEFAKDIIKVNNGFVVVGNYNSRGMRFDIWIIKFDKYGNKVWDKIYGGSNTDEAEAIIQSSDGGFIVVGNTSSKGSGKSKAWIIKVDSSGNKVWDKTVDGHAVSVIQSRDDGFIVLGYSWIIKYNNYGEIIWRKELDDKYSRYTISSITQDKNGALYIGGYDANDEKNHQAVFIKLEGINQ